MAMAKIPNDPVANPSSKATKIAPPAKIAFSFSLEFISSSFVCFDKHAASQPFMLKGLACFRLIFGFPMLLIER
jgi:hypothetical protein